MRPNCHGTTSLCSNGLHLEREVCRLGLTHQQPKPAPPETLIEVGNDYRLADSGPLQAVLAARIHDDTVERTTDGVGHLAELSLDDQRKLDAGHWFDPRFAGEKVPTVDEVFRLIANHRQHDLLVAVDLKAESVVRLAEKYKLLNRLLFIGSTISEPFIREEIKAASTKAQTAVVANNATAVAKHWHKLNPSRQT